MHRFAELSPILGSSCGCTPQTIVKPSNFLQLLSGPPKINNTDLQMVSTPAVGALVRHALG